MKNYSFTFGSSAMFSLKLLINSVFTWNFWQLRFGCFHGSEIFIVRLIFCRCSASVFLLSSPLFHYKTLSHALLCQAHIKTSNYQTPRCFHLETSTIARGATLRQTKKPLLSLQEMTDDHRALSPHEALWNTHYRVGKRQRVWKPHCASECLTCGRAVMAQ